jgi:hypothetical protein
MLQEIAEQALAVPGMASVAIFIRHAGTASLDLGAAAGVSGIPLERLVAAVQDPAHPITRTLLEGFASFDATPMAPGGPALRSHIPLPDPSGGPTGASGVLAVAHDLPLDGPTRARLIALANEAAAATR